MLVARAADQRAQLSDIHDSLEKPLAWLKTGFVVARSIKTYVHVATISMLAVALISGRHLSRVRVWMGRVIALYQISRYLRSWNSRA
ncbi:MAG: YqjK family protein [Gammaproteobacteria bacterium]